MRTLELKSKSRAEVTNEWNAAADAYAGCYDTDVVIGRNGQINAEGYTFPFKEINDESIGKK